MARDRDHLKAVGTCREVPAVTAASTGAIRMMSFLSAVLLCPLRRDVESVESWPKSPSATKQSVPRGGILNERSRVPGNQARR